MSRLSRPLPPGPLLASIAALTALASLAVSLSPELAALAALPSGEWPASRWERLWLAPWAHAGVFDCLLSAAGAGLACLVFPRSDLARGSLWLLLGAPLSIALSAALSPPETLAGGLSSSLFFLGSLISFQLSFSPGRSWTDRLIGGSCLFMLVTRAFFSLTIYGSETLAGQADIIERCAGAGLGAALASLIVAAQFAAAALRRAKTSRLGALG